MASYDLRLKQAKEKGAGATNFQGMGWPRAGHRRGNDFRDSHRDICKCAGFPGGTPDSSRQKPSRLNLERATMMEEPLSQRFDVSYFDENSQQYVDSKEEFARFLEQSDDIKRKVEQLGESQATRLVVDVNELRDYDSKMCAKLLKHPMECIAPYRRAAREFITTVGSAKIDHKKINIGFDGSFGGRNISPRELSAEYLGSIVSVKGIVTRCTAVRPKVSRTVHFCEATSEFTTMTYHDPTSLFNFPTSSIYPNQDNLGNPLRTEFGLSDYTDSQVVTIQEMPELAPPGQLPRSITAVLEADLVDACKPGDRVQIVGVYRAMANTAKSHSGFFKSLIIANHVRGVGKQSFSALTEEDIVNIRKVSKNPNIFELLSRSVAPSIYGHPYIKKALLLQLLGGCEKNLPNGTHIRGDINILMVGDPSTAKSQLLRFVLNIAPLAINTTGRGSSGVGLTAAVVQDKDSGERRLEAGAMVLGDRGVVCIDEFDKMNVADRVAIHEVMEQQTVTIAKAGIHMSLNARCSVLAAANPQYGQYQRSKSPQDNVNLPDSLISRFDLLFIVLDKVSASHDARIADKVLQNHRYKHNGGPVDPFAKDDREATEQKSIYMKSNEDRVDQPVFTVQFLKKYIEFAKARFKPLLTKPAMDFVIKSYAVLRNTEANNKMTAPITARSLETLIRLAAAHAKLHLRKTITENDCKTAMELLNFAIKNEKNEELGDSDEEEEVHDGDSDEDDDDDEDDDSEDQEGEEKGENSDDEAKEMSEEEEVQDRDKKNSQDRYTATDIVKLLHSC
eukprot:1304496-Amorphochlora_amoeboformis.AAC.1